VGDHLEWSDFDDLFERITLQIIFGRRARNDRTLTRTLQKLMRESNRGFALRKSKHFDAFYGMIRGYLADPEENSLVALSARGLGDSALKVENQIPHWMFAMWETLATNCARALALIVEHPEAEARARAEMARADLSTPDGIHSLKYLEGCLQEAMRLWPTTPMLARETVYQTALGGESIPPGTQVLILNNFNHRDRQRLAFADSFSPELWLDGREDYRFNHLSNGPQVCAGKELVFFIGKAVLATLLSNDRYLLLQPALDTTKPLPYTYNYFRIVFARRPITEEAMSNKKNKAVIQRWVDEGLNKATLALAHEIFAANAPLHISGAPEGLRGPEGFIQFATGFAMGLPDLHFTIEDQAAEGDIVVTRFHANGTHTGNLMGIPPTGKQVQFAGIVYDRIVDGKIAERWEVSDFFGLLQQLGAIPAAAPTSVPA
jgi:predicted ester cyclase